jgi:hypothetical protein
MDGATLDAKVWNGDFDILVRSMGGGEQSVVQEARVVHSDRIGLWGTPFHNVWGYNNSRVDWILEQHFVLTDVEELRKLNYEYQGIINDLPIIPLVDVYFPKISSAESHNYGASTGWAGGEIPWEYIWWTKGTLPSPSPSPSPTPGPTPGLAGIDLMVATAVAVMVIIVIAGLAFYGLRRRRSGGADEGRIQDREVFS